MKIVIINQFAPPDESPTARLAGELAEFLESEGHRVAMISGPPGYRKRWRGLGRIFAEGAAWLGLFRGSICCRKVDCWVVFSSPPLVVFVALVAARFRGGRVIHWVLDAYPDIAGAVGVLPRGVLYSFLESLMRRAYRQCDVVIAVAESMRQRLALTYGMEARVIHPWPPCLRAESFDPDEERPGGMRTWLYSGNLGQAHDWEVLLEIQRRLEERGSGWRLILQGGGSGWEAARLAVRHLQLQDVIFREYVPGERLADSLMAADVRVVTCREEAQGLLWPSKLALLRALPGPHLWIGPLLPEEDLGETFKAFSPGQREEVVDWFEERKSGLAPMNMNPAAVREATGRLRQEGLQMWMRVLDSAQEGR